jgi:hypothetical protein
MTQFSSWLLIIAYSSERLPLTKILKTVSNIFLKFKKNLYLHL